MQGGIRFWYTEMNQWGRDKLVEKFSRTKVISMPIWNFSDGFAPHRTMFRPVIGVHLLVAAHSKSERVRMSNVFPPTFWTHAVDFEDVIKALAPLQMLEEGFMHKIGGDPILDLHSYAGIHDS
ncbi:unnamed protein product [Discula destructiva]